MKKMAILFLVIGIVSIALSTYFFTKKEEIVLTPDKINKQKGDDFEDYMIQLLGKQNDIKFVGKVSDYHKNGISALENFEPDLKFRYYKIPFAVECKWRNSFGIGLIDWAENRKIENYKNYQKSKKEQVFVAIGIGGKPHSPEKLYLVPLQMLKYESVKKDYIKDFEIKNDSEIIKFIRYQMKTYGNGFKESNSK